MNDIFYAPKTSFSIALGYVQETVERDLEKLGNVLKMRERSMLYSMKLETKLGRLNQMLEASAVSLLIHVMFWSWWTVVAVCPADTSPLILARDYA